MPKKRIRKPKPRPYRGRHATVHSEPLPKGVPMLSRIQITREGYRTKANLSRVLKSLEGMARYVRAALKSFPEPVPEGRGARLVSW